MSSKTGFPIQRFIVGSGALNPNGVYLGNGLKSTLNKGVYLVNATVGYNSGGGGTTTNSQIVITANALYGTGTEVIICGNSPTGQQGLLAGNEMRVSVSNVYVCPANNTPIFLYMSCTNAAGWAINTGEGAINNVNFTKIG